MLPEGQGLKIPCLIENIDNVTNNNCKAFLKRMESIVFSDYRLIYKFADKCRSDINSLQCGRLKTTDDSSVSIFLIHTGVDLSKVLGGKQKYWERDKRW